MPSYYERKPQLDKVGDLLHDWMDWIVDEVSGHLIDGRRSPGSADLTFGEKLEVFQDLFFNPDGTPNDAKQAEWIERVGIEQFIDIMRALNRRRANQPVEEFNLDYERTESGY